MAKFTQGILCTRAIIDQETNSISYIDVIENIVAHQFPAILHQATLSLQWNREQEGEELRFRISIDWPGNADNKVIEPEVQVLESNRHRFNLMLNGIKFEHAGELKFLVEQLVKNKWKTVYKLSCPITESEDQ